MSPRTQKREVMSDVTSEACLDQDANTPGNFRTQSERKRADILDAAIEAFLENGFQGSSMDAISTRAKVSKRTVYNHFQNKEALFQAIVQELFTLISAKQDFSYDPAQPLDAQLTAIARRTVKLFDDPHMRRLLRVIFAESIHSAERISAALQRFQEDEKGLDHWIASAVDDGRFKPVEPKYAAEQFMGLIKATTFWPQLVMNQPSPSPEHCEHVVHDSVTMFLNYYAL